MTPEQLNEARAVAGKLTKAQRRAVLRMDKRYRPVREIGTSGATLFALNDLWRDERGVQPPIQLAVWDVDDSGPLTRVWSLTSLGLAVRTILQEHPNG